MARTCGFLRIDRRGRAVACVAEYDSDSRTEAIWRQVEEVLASQIKCLYLGEARVSIGYTLQAGARQVEQAANEWICYCPALLQIEFEPLLNLPLSTHGDREHSPKICR